MTPRQACRGRVAILNADVEPPALPLTPPLPDYDTARASLVDLAANMA